MSPTQALNIQHNIMVSGLATGDVARPDNHYLRLPTGYDPMTKYPTVFLGPGCGGTGKDVIPMQNASMGNAILVGLSPVGQCFKTNGAASPDNQFFDAVLKEVEANVAGRQRGLRGGFQQRLLAGQPARLFAPASSAVRATRRAACPATCRRARARSRPCSPTTRRTPRTRSRAASRRATASSRSTAAWARTQRPTTRARRRRACSTRAARPRTPSSGARRPAAIPDQIPISTTGFWKFWSSLPWIVRCAASRKGLQLPPGPSPMLRKESARRSRASVPA